MLLHDNIEDQHCFKLYSRNSEIQRNEAHFDRSKLVVASVIDLRFLSGAGLDNGVVIEGSDRVGIGFRRGNERILLIEVIRRLAIEPIGYVVSLDRMLSCENGFKRIHLRGVGEGVKNLKMDLVENY